ncbi:MAG: anaerobic ribonucleoside-triphosphate reductase activating protein [Candidatus Altiarchaeales archaeon IMC4]|nr:MAG: anaerobic ribonucleoside-triphosphate reductase activating protein [Candidatus Altiarchaeales archaeon IMC4]
MTEKIKLAGITDSSSIDYPGKISAVVYLCGCPFRCPWCQNPELVLEEGYRLAEIDEIINELKNNFLIDAVCITGGEPLAQKETIELLRRIKSETKLLLKIDHNCFFPDMLEKALPYLDHLTTDIKAPLDERYGKVTGLPGSWEKIVANVKKSHEILACWPGKKEARTTVVPGLIDKDDEIREIAKVVHGVGFDSYVIQQFRPDKTLEERFERVKSPSVERMRELGKIAKKELPDTDVRIVTTDGGFETVG